MVTQAARGPRARDGGDHSPGAVSSVRPQGPAAQLPATRCSIIFCVFETGAEDLQGAAALVELSKGDDRADTTGHGTGGFRFPCCFTRKLHSVCNLACTGSVVVSVAVLQKALQEVAERSDPTLFPGWAVGNSGPPMSAFTEGRLVKDAGVPSASRGIHLRQLTEDEWEVAIEGPDRRPVPLPLELLEAIKRAQHGTAVSGWSGGVKPVEPPTAIHIAPDGVVPLVRQLLPVVAGACACPGVQCKSAVLRGRTGTVHSL